MTQIEQIKAEIERLKGETHIGISEYDKGVENGRMEVLDVLFKFTDSLSMEETSYDFKDAAIVIANGIMIGVQGNKYHTNVYNTERNDFNHSHLVQAAIDGMQWQKEQMMKHTIEGCYIHRNRYTKHNVLNGLNPTDKVFQNFKNGDKLQLVVIKEGGEVWGA